MQWSDNLFNVLGIDREKGELSFEAFLEQVHPDDRPMFYMDPNASVPDEMKMEYRFFRPSGEMVWIKNNYVPIFENGQLVGLH